MPEIDVDLFTTPPAIASAGSVCRAGLVSILVTEKHHMKEESNDGEEAGHLFVNA